MAVRGSLYGGSGSNFNTVLLQNQTLPYSSSPSPSFLGSGSRSMFSFGDVNVEKRSNRPFFCSFDQEDNVDEDSDEYFHQPEKKRRLKVDQIQFLEKRFEADNKLEPERKIQLAKDLGLQPRQIAIWFQNRRARWKTKQIEKDYDVLQASYNSLKANYDDLLKEKEKLKAEVHCLTDRLLLNEREKGCSELSDAMTLSEAPHQEYIEDLAFDGNVSYKDSIEARYEDINSAKSDVLDASSPRCNRVHSPSLLDPVDSSYVYQHDQSDLSQDEDNWTRSMLRPPAYAFQKIEDGVYSDPHANSRHFGLLDDDDTFGF